MKTILYCTQLKKEEKALILAAQQSGLSMEYQLVRNRVDYPTEPVVAIIRTMGHSESIYLSNSLELRGSKTLNSSVAIRYCSDKSLAALLMQSSGVSQPKFEVAFSPEQLQEGAKRFDYPFVIKPLSASWGRGICLVRDSYCLDNWLAGRESLDATHKNFPVMLQEYIDKPGYDIRVLIVGEEAIVAFKRKSEHWITNTHLGATVEKIELNAEIKGIVKKIIQVIGPGFYGLDLFETKEGHYLFNEINHNPDFSYSSSVHKINVAEKYIEYICNDYKKLH